MLHPRPVLHPYLDPPPLALSHQGLSPDGTLSNAMPAFAAAVALGVRYLETDVHASADGVLVVHHDATLDRMTDAGGAIAALPWDVVRRARVGGVAEVPRLEDLLAAWPQVRLNVDVKASGAVRPLAALLRRPGVAERLCVASFSDARRGGVLRAAGPLPPPGAAYSLGVARTASLWLAAQVRRILHSPGRALVRSAAGGAVALQVPTRVGPVPVITPALLDAAHEAGLQVHAWTVDRPGQMRDLLDLGVDGIVTNRVDTLAQILAERGAWPPRRR